MNKKLKLLLITIPIIIGLAAMGCSDLSRIAADAENAFAVYHILTFYANDGSGTTKTQAIAEDSTAALLANTFINATDSSLIFAGWSATTDGSVEYADRANYTMGTSDAELYAIWEEGHGIAYTLTYNGNGNTGGSVPTDSNAYEEGDTATVLGNTGSLVRTGYVFTGWNAESDLSGTDYGAGATVTFGSSDITLYAKWVPSSSIIFQEDFSNTGDLDGSTPDVGGNWACNSAAESFEVETAGVFDTNTDSTEGACVFAAFADGAVLGPGETLTLTFETTVTDGTFAYSDWAGFSLLSGYTSPSASYDERVFMGSASSVSGWGVDQAVFGGIKGLCSDGTIFSDSDAYIPSGKTNFTDQTQTCYFTYNYDTGAMLFTVGGFEISGEGSETSKNFALNAVRIGHASTTDIAITNIYIDKQSEVTYHTVTFHSNDGNDTTYTQSIAEDTTANLDAGTFTRSGYSFAGWSTSASGSLNYADGQEYTMGSSDVDLYAVWTDTDDVLIKLTFDNSSDYCADTSGNSNNGIGYNMYYADDGNGGYAASFNGLSSYIELPYQTFVRENFTVMMRFNVGTTGCGALLGYQNVTIPNISSVTAFIPIIIVQDDGKVRGTLWTGSWSPNGEDITVLSDTTVNDGNWHTVYFSAKANSIALYLDGEQVGDIVTGTVGALNMYYNQIGTAYGKDRDTSLSGASGTYYFNGLIDNFYMYTTALH